MTVTRNIAGPVVHGRDLWGRDRELSELRRLLERGSVLVSAPRRYGKTSLVTALEQSPPRGAIAIHVDVEYVETPAEFLGEITTALLQHDTVGLWFRKATGIPHGLANYVRGAIDEVGVGIGGVGEAKLKLRDALLDPSAWKPLCEELFGVLRRIDSPIVVLIDEFPVMIGRWIARSPIGLGPTGLEVSRDFLHWMRAFRQPIANAHVRFLLYGSVNLEPLLARHGMEALVNDLQRFRLDPLDDARATDFVRVVLTTEGCDFDVEVPTAIVGLVGGVHFFLQVTIAEVMRDAGKARISTTRVDSVYRDSVLGAANRAQFSHWLARIRNGYGSHDLPAMQILSILARGPASVDQLRAELCSRGHSDPDTVLALLEGDYYIVIDDGRVRFLHPLLADWWKRHAPAGSR